MLELASAMSKLLQKRYKRIFKEKMKHFEEYASLVSRYELDDEITNTHIHESLEEL